MTQNLQKQNLCTSPLWDGVVVLTILCALGFPGMLGEAMGSGVNLLLQYLPFVMQLLVMLFSSADRVEELQLIHLEKKYLPVYLMLLGWFGLSMLVSSFPKEQLIACTRFTVTAFFALWMSERYDPERLLKMTLYAEMLFVCSTLLSVLLFPRASFSYEAGERALRGICPSKNSCAYVLSFGLVMQAASLFCRDVSSPGNPADPLQEYRRNAVCAAGDPVSACSGAKNAASAEPRMGLHRGKRGIPDHGVDCSAPL